MFHWEYPLFVVPHGGGYASIVDPENESVQCLVVYTDKVRALEFMQQFGLTNDPRPLRSDREFSWLLGHLRAPVSLVAFDPQPLNQTIGARWMASVSDLLEDHLRVDFSPWTYPCYVIAQESGFASITGQTSDGRPLTAVALFTDSAKASDYLKAAGEAGTLCRLADLDQARKFLSSLSLKVFSVALDPRVEDGQRTAKYCFDIATLLEKYLVRES